MIILNLLKIHASIPKSALKYPRLYHDLICLEARRRPEKGQVEKQQTTSTLHDGLPVLFLFWSTLDC